MINQKIQQYKKILFKIYLAIVLEIRRIMVLKLSLKKKMLVLMNVLSEKLIPAHIGLMLRI